MQARSEVAQSIQETRVPTRVRASSRRSLIVCTKMQSVATNDKSIFTQHVLMLSAPFSLSFKVRAANDKVIQSDAVKAAPTYLNG